MKLTPEQLKMNAAAMVAFANGNPVQYRSIGVSRTGWTDAVAPKWNFSIYEYREKIAPIFRPWDFNSRPRAVQWVYRKGYITDCQVVAWGDDVVVIATKHGLLNQSYSALFNDWLQRDGTPCGTVEEPC